MMILVCAAVNGILAFVIMAATGLRIDQSAYWIVTLCLVGVILNSMLLGKV